MKTLVGFGDCKLIYKYLVNATVYGDKSLVGIAISILYKPGNLLVYKVVFCLNADRENVEFDDGI